MIFCPGDMIFNWIKTISIQFLYQMYTITYQICPLYTFIFTKSFFYNIKNYISSRIHPFYMFYTYSDVKFDVESEFRYIIAIWNVTDRYLI